MLLVEAAQGRTRQEILTALRLPSNLNEIRNAAYRVLSPFVVMTMNNLFTLEKISINCTMCILNFLTEYLYKKDVKI